MILNLNRSIGVAGHRKLLDAVASGNKLATVTNSSPDSDEASIIIQELLGVSTANQTIGGKLQLHQLNSITPPSVIVVVVIVVFYSFFFF